MVFWIQPALVGTIFYLSFWYVELYVYCRMSDRIECWICITGFVLDRIWCGGFTEPKREKKVDWPLRHPAW